MISIRTAFPLVMGVLLANAAGAAEAAQQAARPATGVIVAPRTPAPTPAPAARTKGVGIPGELLFSTPSLDATWQVYRKRLALFSLVDKRANESEPLLISQDAFVIHFADDRTLRSSQMEAGSASIALVKANPAGATVAEKLGGRQATVSLSDPDGRVSAKWTVIDPDNADYLYQTVTLSAGKETRISELHLVMVQLKDAKVASTPEGSAAVTDKLFLGVKHPKASVTIDEAKVHGLIKQAITLAPNQDFEAASVIGASADGQAAQAFKAALAGGKTTAPAKPAAAAAKKDEKKDEKKAAKKEEKKAEPQVAAKPAEAKPQAAEKKPEAKPAPAPAKPVAAAKPQAAPQPVYKFPDNVNATTPVPVE